MKPLRRSAMPIEPPAGTKPASVIVSTALSSAGPRPAKYKRRSFQKQPSPQKTSESVLDYVTGAEDIYETKLFQSGTPRTSAGESGGLTFVRTNLTWEGPPGTSSQTRKTKETVAEFLKRWEIALKGRIIPMQYLTMLEGGKPVEGHSSPKETGPLNISSDEFDELFATMNLAKPFFRCLWTTRDSYGFREKYAKNPEAIDIWYTVPLSVIVDGEGNFNLASSAIYSRYLPSSPQISFVLVVLRYNWEGSSLAGRPTKEFERILEEYEVQPDMDFGKRRAMNGFEWHLAPQVAYFAMALVFWREGLAALEMFTHEQERKMHEALSVDNEGQAAALRVSSIHLRLKYLYEERDGLQYICQVLESLHNFWRDMAQKESNEFGITGDAEVGAIEDLRLLCREFGSQLQIRDQLVNRLGNLQSLYFNLAASRIAKSSKRDNTAMKTIAAVTSIFLPATFVATFLSMSFFDYGDPQISVSPSIWIYFAAAVPLSVLILGGMAYWLRRVGVWERKMSDEENLRQDRSTMDDVREKHEKVKAG